MDRKMAYSAYVKEGEKCEASGDLEGAIEYYTKAIDKQKEFYRKMMYEDKPDYMLHYKRACTYQKMKEMEKAADDFKVFLLADDRRTELDTTWWKFLVKATRLALIVGQRQKAKSCLTQQTFKKILSTYDFDIDRYSNKKLYDWGPAMIGDTPEEASKMLKERPQEVAYRMGVKRLLQGKQKKAIQHLNEAIEMNPEDARSYLFRGVAHALQSHKGRRLRRSAREFSKTKASSDIERAKVLSKGNALIEQACIRMRARIRALAPPAPSTILTLGLGIIGIAIFIFGITTLIGGIVSLALYVVYARFFSLLAGFFCLPCGVLALVGCRHLYKGSHKRGCAFIIIAGFLFFVFVLLSFHFEL